MLTYLQHAKLLLLCELKSFDGCNGSNSLLFERAMEQSWIMLRGWIFVGQQIIGDLTGRFPEPIGDDGIHGDVADRKAVWEAFLLVRECPHLGDGYDGGNEKTFVDIDATADGGNDFHVGNPPFMVEERHCLSMPSKNDKSKPMISIRSKRSTYLCLSGGMEFIMSKWKETQDNIVRELHIDNVTEEIKQRVSASIVNEVLPPIEDAVNKFSTIIQA